MNAMLKEELETLLRITAGCRDDMHEPDEQGITATVEGDHLDNAMGSNPPEHSGGELNVCIQRVTQLNGVKQIERERFNLATLIALARKCC